MASKNLPTSIKIVSPVEYWYLVGMSRQENLCLPGFIIWLNTILNHIDTRAILQSMKSLAWYIDPNGVGNKNPLEYQYPTDIKICEILVIDNPIGFLRRRHHTNTGHDIWM